MSGRLERLGYAVGQAARISWFFGQYALAARLSGPSVPADRRPADLQTPETREILVELRRLMEKDWANIEAGYYRVPHDLILPPAAAVADALRFFRDLPEVQRRRRGRVGNEVRRRPPPGSERMPAYYRQNFHFQTDGYLSDHSARLYDHQVEVLFGGGADAMRRQALVPIHHRLRGRSQRARLVDLGCGTGRFLTFVKDNYPRLRVAGVDLSPHYLAEARRRLAPWSRVDLVRAAAESLPFQDGSADVVTCVYLLHELPRKVRRRVAEEAARVLAPGGLLVIVDSIQKGDRPTLDGLLELFPIAFHEPYYADYTRQDLVALFEGAGLRRLSDDLAFMSKVIAFERPA